MEITCERDLKDVAHKMHDSEFSDGDFYYNATEEKFVLNSRAVTMHGRFVQRRAAIQSGPRFHLELFNVTKYNARNLEKVRAGKAMGGVFDYIKIRERGRRLAIVSQDLSIELELTELAGKFEQRG